MSGDESGPPASSSGPASPPHSDGLQGEFVFTTDIAELEDAREIGTTGMYTDAGEVLSVAIFPSFLFISAVRKATISRYFALDCSSCLIVSSAFPHRLCAFSNRVRSLETVVSS